MRQICKLENLVSTYMLVHVYVVFAFRYNATCVAVDIGLNKSDVLSTLPNSTIALEIPPTSPVNIGLANGA